MSFLTQKPKHYKDSEIIATRMGWELKKTGEILSSFAFAGGLPNPVESVYLKKHGLTIEPPRAAPAEPASTPRVEVPTVGEAPSSDISKETLNKVDKILNPQPASPNPAETQPPAPKNNDVVTSQPAQPTVPPVVNTPSPAPVTPETNVATPQPVAPAETATSGNTIRFTFEHSTGDETSDTSGTVKLKSVINAVRAGDPEGWTGAFVDVDGHKAIRTLSSEGKGTRYIESEGFTSDGSTDVTLIVPFRMSAGGSNGGAYAFAMMKDRNIINPSLIMTNEEAGFKVRFYDSVTINDSAIKPTTAYPFDKWHIAVLKVSANEANAFDKIRIGTNQNGNTARHITIGDGFEIIKGDSSKVSEKVNALMTAYNIQK